MSDNLTPENKTRIIDIINDFFGGGLEDIIEEMPKLRAENESLRAENETLRRNVKTAIMGDSAELADVKRENERLRDVLKNCIAALRHAYFHGFTELYKTTADEAAAAIKGSEE